MFGRERKDKLRGILLEPRPRGSFLRGEWRRCLSLALAFQPPTENKGNPPGVTHSSDGFCKGCAGWSLGHDDDDDGDERDTKSAHGVFTPRKPAWRMSKGAGAGGGSRGAGDNTPRRVRRCSRGWSPDGRVLVGATHRERDQ